MISDPETSWRFETWKREGNFEVLDIFRDGKFGISENVRKNHIPILNPSENTHLGGGFKYFLFSPHLGKIPILTNIFQIGWKPPAGHTFPWWFPFFFLGGGVLGPSFLPQQGKGKE